MSGTGIDTAAIEAKEMNPRDLWIAGENKAADYLDRLGYEILERNYKTKYGEIDIVALDEDVLCFVEVKTRRDMKYGMPCQAVGWRKQEHLKRAAWVYMRKHRRHVSGIRIDIVEVIYTGGRFYARLLRNCGR